MFFCDTVYSVICSPAIWLGCEENSVKIFAIATVPRDGGGYVQGVWKITIFDLVLALFHKRLRYEKRIGTHMRSIERCCLQWPWMTPVSQILKARSCANLYLKFDGWLSLWLATFSFFLNFTYVGYRLHLFYIITRFVDTDAAAAGCCHLPYCRTTHML